MLLPSRSPSSLEREPGVRSTAKADYALPYFFTSAMPQVGQLPGLSLALPSQFMGQA